MAVDVKTPRSKDEWTKLALEACRAAINGDIEKRLTNIDCDGDFGDLLHAINDLLDRVDCFVRETQIPIDHQGQRSLFLRVAFDDAHDSFTHTREIIRIRSTLLQYANRQRKRVA